MIDGHYVCMCWVIEQVGEWVRDKVSGSCVKKEKKKSVCVCAVCKRKCGSGGGRGIRQRRTMAFKWIWELVNHTKREPKCSADCLDVRVSGRQEGTNEQENEREPQRDTLLTPEQNASIRNQWPTYANDSTYAQFLRLKFCPWEAHAVSQDKCK